ncbi:hypothetical protein BJP36_23585 [Moorena producens JHB]|uniref:Uncharacterized protein n=1 Tax=Moorena producens (strain JHB) TaxID=1454205 RepID=A0A1D9G4J1_MOOP1|nr:hypothetical protein [Moorena producens]AOY82444.1 hypothetical protein BJP36_23585 [Moorena producens JHB]
MNKSSLLEKASSQEITTRDCSVEIWMKEVAQKQRLGTTYGRDAKIILPDRVLNESPLRQSLIDEFAFKALSEDYGTRGICHLAAMAQSSEEHEFLVTQVFDEAMHARAFKHHLEEIGACDTNLDTFIREKYAEEIRFIFTPLNDFFHNVAIENKNYLGGVTILTIILEGVLAPTAEMGELKWQRLNPVASNIQHQANLDEIRHLTICANIIKEAIERNPQVLGQVGTVLYDGMELWKKIPIKDIVYKREVLFQKGMFEHKNIVGDQPLTEELRLIDSTPEQRLQLTFEWTQQMQASRIKYMGLEKLMQ